MDIQSDVPLSERVTLALGGPARRLAVADGAGDVRRLLRWARERGFPVLVLGGGSNVVPPDRGWPGLVIEPGEHRLSFRPAVDASRDDAPGRVDVEAGAGLAWDRLVEATVRRGLAGVERLSGIPGTVGAAPVQNIGAYGQELSDTLVSVDVLDRRTLEERTLPASACALGYRRSRFNREDRGRFVILRVRLALRRASPGPDGAVAAMDAARRETLAVRRRKGMLVGTGPPSAGSFFRNPVLSDRTVREIRRRWKTSGGPEPVPVRAVDGGTKIPAAWLVERAGFPRGTRRGAVGISGHHALALVNHGGGTARELTGLAEDVRAAVRETFGVRLEIEPSVIRPGRLRDGAPSGGPSGPPRTEATRGAAGRRPRPSRTGRPPPAGAGPPRSPRPDRPVPGTSTARKSP